MRTHNTIFGPETEHSPPSRKRKFRYVVKLIDLIERPFGLEDLCDEEYIEAQLAELTEGGERVVAVTRGVGEVLVTLASIRANFPRTPILPSPKA